jgi:gamma-glutamyl-gamma-aminobutyrate hydrolase PuuD
MDVGSGRASEPWIGVVAYHLAPGRVPPWLTGAYAVPDNYVEAVRRAGGRPVLLLPGERGDARDLLELVDGLLLVGGGDVEPTRYGGQDGPTIYGVEPERDALEFELLRSAADASVPTLAVCRGVQVMNVAFGGTLIPHLPDRPGMLPHGTPSGEDHRMHVVKAAPNSLLASAAGGDVLECSTHHHQGVDALGENLLATAWSDDGLVEAIERPSGWMVGVQWHPEDTADRDAAQQRLFDALVSQVGRADPRSPDG